MNRSLQLKAMASEVRMAMLRYLDQTKIRFPNEWPVDPVEFGICMSLIARAMNISQPTVSRHLDILKQAGFITVRKQHKWSYCKRDNAAIQEYLDWLQWELSPKG